MYIHVNDVSMVLCIINSIYWLNRIFLHNIIVKIVIVKIVIVKGHYVTSNKVNVEVLNKTNLLLAVCQSQDEKKTIISRATSFSWVGV